MCLNIYAGQDCFWITFVLFYNLVASMLIFTLALFIDRTKSWSSRSDNVKLGLVFCVLKYNF